MTMGVGGCTWEVACQRQGDDIYTEIESCLGDFNSITLTFTHVTPTDILPALLSYHFIIHFFCTFHRKTKNSNNLVGNLVTGLHLDYSICPFLINLYVCFIITVFCNKILFLSRKKWWRYLSEKKRKSLSHAVYETCGYWPFVFFSFFKGFTLHFAIPALYHQHYEMYSNRQWCSPQLWYNLTMVVQYCDFDHNCQW